MNQVIAGSTTSMAKKRVAVGLSGGVDSSVTAALLLKEGFDVIGFFMKNWEDADDLKAPECPWKEDRQSAIQVASTLNIPLKTLDYSKQYRDRIVEYMLTEYKSGRTPNPDVLCNRAIKFDLLWDAAREAECDYLATGHYARLEDGELKMGLDPNKDQSYFLCTTPKDALNNVLFPIGEIEKPDVRKLAKKYNLPSATRPDSQGLCFIGEINISDFLKQRYPSEEGKIVDSNSNIIGRHQGAWAFTVGQREGIGVANNGPWYVTKIDVKFNTVHVTNNPNDSKLFSTKLVATDINWFKDLGSEFKASARIRYRQEVQDCTVRVLNDQIEVLFTKPQRAVTPGQIICLYQDDIVIAGGIISK